MQRRAFFLAVMTAAVLAAGCAPNPNANGVDTYGDVTGRLVDAASGLPIPNAQLFMGGVTTGITPGNSGGFTLQHVPIGRQTLRVYVTGYQLTEGGQSIDVNVQAGANDVGILKMSSIVSAPTPSPLPTR